MQLTLVFNSQLTIPLLYKLAVHRAILCPTWCHHNVMPQLLIS